MFHGVVHPWRTTWISVLIKSEISCSLLPICASLNWQWKEGHTPPWINKEILRLIKKKKKLWHELKAQPSQSLRQMFKDLRSTVKKIIRSEYHKYLQHLSDVLKENLKRFWFYHSIKSKSKRLPDISTYKPEEQANLINIYFRSVFWKVLHWCITSMITSVPIVTQILCHVIQLKSKGYYKRLMPASLLGKTKFLLGNWRKQHICLQSH